MPSLHHIEVIRDVKECLNCGAIFLEYKLVSEGNKPCKHTPAQRLGRKECIPNTRETRFWALMGRDNK